MGIGKALAVWDWVGETNVNEWSGGRGVNILCFNILTDMKNIVDKCFLICYSKYNS